jgi:uncharacterized membrane protein
MSEPQPQDVLGVIAGRLRRLDEQIASVEQRLDQIEARLLFIPAAQQETTLSPRPVDNRVSAVSPAPGDAPGPAGVTIAAAAGRGAPGVEAPAPVAPYPPAPAHPAVVPLGGSTSAPVAHAPAPPAPPRETGAPGDASDWERLLGGKWALWIGSVAVFLAVAFFLAYTWRYLGPGGRFTIGLLAGALFLAAAGYSRQRFQQGFSEGLAGCGLAILYLSTWAGFQSYHLLPYAFGFGLMVITTVLGVWVAVRWEAQSLSVLSLLGGFLTPVLLRSAGSVASEAAPLFSYLATLNGGILAVSLFKRWRGMIWLSLAATLAVGVGWAAGSYVPSQRWVVFSFATVYFLMFLGAACFHSLMRGEETRPEDLLLLFGDAFTYALTGYLVLENALDPAPAAFPLAVAVGFLGLGTVVARRAPANATLRQSAEGLALFFLTVAVPVQLRQSWIAVAWSIEAAVLITLATRHRSPLLDRAAQILWLLSVVSVFWTLVGAPVKPVALFVNARALPLVVSVLATVWMAFLSGARERSIEDQLAVVYPAYAALGAAWLLAQETFLWFSWSPSGTSWQAAALYAVGCLWGVYALAVLALGFRLRVSTVRGSALLLGFLAALLPIWNGLAQPAEWVPFANLRFYAFATVTAMLALAGRLLLAHREDLTPSETQLLPAAGVSAMFLGLWGLTSETYETFRWSAMVLGPNWGRAAQMGISLVWILCGSGLLVAGVARRARPVRLFGLGLLGLTVLKVFLYDLSYLDTPYRIVCFAGLGLSLIGISWLYNRFREEPAKAG